MLYIAPSLLAADFSDLQNEIRRMEDAGANYLHLDIMDGHFVPNISFGAGLVRSIRRHTRLFFDVHLMISDPLRYAEDFIRAGADIITSDVDFYWMHFKLPDARMLPDDAGLPQDDHCLLLPDERTLPDPDRLAVMCGQLIDIYARFGPYSNAYCDYFATGLLLEVSAQERLKADFAAHRTLAGYRGDGKPITSADRVRQQQEWAMHVDSAGAAGDSSGLAPMLAIRSWIMANAFDDITVAKVAARFHYSPSYLTAMYRRVFGVGVAEQIIEYRIDRARELLSSTASSVADIAREVGYADPKYFMRVFKRRTGLTPGQYRDAFPARLYNTV